MKFLESTLTRKMPSSEDIEVASEAHSPEIVIKTEGNNRLNQDDNASTNDSVSDVTEFNNDTTEELEMYSGANNAETLVPNNCETPGLCLTDRLMNKRAELSTLEVMHSQEIGCNSKSHHESASFLEELSILRQQISKKEVPKEDRLDKFGQYISQALRDVPKEIEKKCEAMLMQVVHAFIDGFEGDLILVNKDKSK